MGTKRKRCFIIGSGRSLLDLTAADKRLLSDHPRTLAMNKYLLYHDVIGLQPKAVFLADRTQRAPMVFVELARVANSLIEPPVFYVNEYYDRLFARMARGLVWRVGERLRYLRRFGDWIPLYLELPELVCFQSGLVNHGPFYWADALSQQLYFYRASLTTAINLMSITEPDSDIHLVGVDLKGGYFFDEVKDRFARLWEPEEEHEDHATARTVTSFLGVQAVLPGVAKELRSRDIGLYCSNRDSLLVDLGICDHAPISDGRSSGEVLR